jgi:hypothetical protein
MKSRMGTDIHAIFQKKTEDGWEDISSTFDQNRHYFLFAWLANVRNGYGFAGVPIFEPLTPISPPRGLPSDFEIESGSHSVTDEFVLPPFYRRYADEVIEEGYWMGDHSFSWLTDDDILEAEPPEVVRTGVISMSQYGNWDGESPPDSYSGGVSGPDVVVSPEESITDKTTHVQVYWESRAEELDYFIKEIVRLKDKYGEIRMVFGFDS